MVTIFLLSSIKYMVLLYHNNTFMPIVNTFLFHYEFSHNHRQKPKPYGSSI